jgi:hypothetical protein
MRLRAKTSSWEQGPDFDLVRTCEWLSYVRASGSISIQFTATLSVMSDILPLQSSRSIFGVLLWIQGFGYDYIMIMIIVFTYL